MTELRHVALCGFTGQARVQVDGGVGASAKSTLETSNL